MKAYREIHVLNWVERSPALRAMLKFCGRERVVSRDYRWHGLRRGDAPFILWQHTLSGEGALLYDGREYRLRAGDTMVLRVPHEHCYFLSEDADSWEFLFAGVNGREAIRLCREIEWRFGPVHALGENSPAARLLEETVRTAAEKRIRDRFHASTLAYALTMALAAETDRGAAATTVPNAIQKALDFRAADPETLPDVETLARAAGLSKWHFSRLFKQATGLTPATYVRDHALKRAEALLQSGGFSVKEAAAACGFADVSVFCRAFKKAYGFSPGKINRA